MKKWTTPANDARPAAAGYEWARMIDSYRAKRLKTAVVVDGNNIFVREHFAHAGLRLSTGFPTSGLYGWARDLVDLATVVRPEYLAIAWDGDKARRGDTFRKRIFPSYKSTRRPTDEDLAAQLESSLRFDLVDLLGIAQFDAGVCTVPGEAGMPEADDVIATLVRNLAEAGIVDTVLVISSDSDLLQLVGDRGKVEVRVLRPKSGISEMEDGGEAYVTRKFGGGPGAVRLYKATVGDTSDAIPGVSGFGEKKFPPLVEAMHAAGYDEADEPLGLEALYDEKVLAALPPKVRALLEDHAEDAATAYTLAGIRDDVEIPGFDTAALQFSPERIDWSEFYGALEALEFKTLLPAPTQA